MKALIIDDDKDLCEIIMKLVSSEGVDAECCYDGHRAIRLVEKNVYDFIILDVMMPHIDGWMILRSIRMKSSVPVIMLTALDDDRFEVYGFELGVNDYITKPFKKSVLLARIRNVIRTNSKQMNSILKYHALTVDKTRMQVSISEKVVPLTPMEYRLMLFLMTNKGRVITREVVLESVWGVGYEKTDRTLDTHIKTLRTKLMDYGKYIRTIRGFGYMFEEESDD